MCKWNYSASPDGNNKWNDEFFEQIHLKDLKKDNWRKIGIIANLYNNRNCFYLGKFKSLHKTEIISFESYVVFELTS